MNRNVKPPTTNIVLFLNILFVLLCSSESDFGFNTVTTTNSKILPIIDSNYVVLHLAIPFVSLTLRFSQKW
jgi:hypothetical protein